MLRRAIKIMRVRGRDEIDRVAIWLRGRLGGERMTTVAADYGCRDGSGVDRVVERLEKKANDN